MTKVLFFMNSNKVVAILRIRPVCLPSFQQLLLLIHFWPSFCTEKTEFFMNMEHLTLAFSSFF